MEASHFDEDLTVFFVFQAKGKDFIFQRKNENTVKPSSKCEAKRKKKQKITR
jgi:hypothetical protein